MDMDRVEIMWIQIRNRALWYYLMYLTLGVFSARVRHRAGVDTLLVDAGQLAGTLGV